VKLFGSLLHLGRPVAQNLTIHLRVSGTHWHGEIQLPKGASISAGSYRLLLKDRREARITIDTIQGETAYFEGDAALKKN
jgi:hypothetical protein